MEERSEQLEVARKKFIKEHANELKETILKNAMSDHKRV